MRAELDIKPEIQAELEFIERGIAEGMAALPIQDTTGLCHQINWAISYRLNRTFGWEVLEYNPRHLQNRNLINPFISYVNKGEIFGRSKRRHHSFPLLIGVSPDILLIDGANDQTDPEDPTVPGPGYPCLGNPRVADPQDENP